MFRFRLLFAFAPLALFISSSPTYAQGTLLLGTDATVGNLIRINPATAGVTVIGPLGQSFVTDLAWNPATSTLYGTTTSTDRLVPINPITGAATIIGSLGTIQMHGCDFDTTTGTLYGVTTGSNRLWTINTTTGAATLVGPTSGNSLVDLAFDSTTSTMYASNGNDLFTVNLSTGATTHIGQFGTGVFAMQGLAFDPVLGLIGSDTKSDSSINDQLFQINTATAVPTLIGNLNSGNTLGLTFIPSAAVPEPATWAMIGISVLLGGYAFRRATLHRGTELNKLVEFELEV